jgi:non-specific serine/threonine protein kinase
VERAEAVKREFALDDANASIVADIVRRLDGIALAIELAAARIKVLGVKQLSEKLDERFKLLTGGSRTVLPRQQTLRALIDWSYGLLSDDEQRMFRKAAVFAGGFTLELVVAVCAGDIEEFDVIDLLQSLVDKSLLQSEEIGAEARYRFLESTRAFAHEKLVASGEYGEAAKAHAAALMELAERLGEEWRANRASENVSDSRRELDNWRAALRWSLREKGDIELGQQLVAALRFAWAQFALAEGRSWIAEATAAETSSPPQTLARLRLADAHVATLFTNYKVAYAAAKAALDLLDPESDRRLVAEAQLLAGAALGILGSCDEGESLLREALETFRVQGARNDVGTALQSLGIIRTFIGDVAGSREFYAQALVAYRDANADVQAASMALNLAEVEFQAGNATKALDLANEALASDSLRLEETSIVYGLCNVAAYELSMDRIREATAHARKALALSQAIGSEISRALALQHLATAVALHSSKEAAENSDRNAAAILGFVDRSFEELGYAREHTELREYERALALLGESIGDELRTSMISEGRLWTVDKVLKITEDVTRNL